MKINDSLPNGCAVGCVCQLGFFFVTGLLTSLAAVFESEGGPRFPFQVKEVLFMSWGITQWIALIPLIMSQRAAGHSKTVQGMLISGCIGVLLSSACAGVMIYTTGAGM